MSWRSHVWVHAEGNRPVSQGDSHILVFAAAFMYEQSCGVEANCPDAWIKKMQCVYIYTTKYLFNHKEGDLTICDMNTLGGVMPSDRA